MKGTRRSKVWLALGLVAMASLVLAGCPHNNLLDSSGGGGSGNGGGSRGGSDGVRLVVTNFVDGGPVASRSIGWLGGPQRTIAPEHIDLTVEDEIKKYVFVASATGNGIWGPKFIDLAPGTGSALLDISDPGEWRITVDAYEVGKLVAANVGTSRDDIMTKDVGVVTARMATDLVLSGSATVHVGGGSQATLSLTNDRVAGAGSVRIAVHFTDQDDVAEIFAGGDYRVTAELVNTVTQQTVMVNTDSTEVTLYSQPGGGPLVDTDPNAPYTYRVYDRGNPAKYQTETIQTNGGNTKVLLYNPKAAAGGDLQVPKGRYQLRVTVENTTDGTMLYRTDPAFYVDSNRVVEGVFTIDGIIGATPTEPTGFDVAWTKPSTTDQLAGYSAEFLWGQSDIWAAGYEIELADITSIYKYEGTDKKVILTAGEQVFADAEELWEKLDGDQDVFSKHVTKLNWKTNVESHLDTPRWQSGSLLSGSGSLTLRLASGSVYSARIRAIAGSNAASDWVYIGAAGAPAPGNPPAKFNAPATHGIFDLMKFAYTLKGMDMYTLAADRSGTMQVVPGGDTKVEGEALLQVTEYVPGTPAQLSYAFTGNTVDAKTVGDQVLTTVGVNAIVDSWLGWSDTTPGGGHPSFGPVTGAKTGGAVWAKADWSYDGFADLNLEPAGAGGSGLNVQANTSGTSNVLTLKTIGFGTAAPNGTDNQDTLENLTTYDKLTSNVAGIYKNAGEDTLVLVMKRTAAGAGYTYDDFRLYVSVGDNANPKVAETLTDKNGNPIQVADVKAKIESNAGNKSSSSFVGATGGVPAYALFDRNMMGMRSGPYTLMVEILAGGVMPQTMQLPIILLYEDQVATTDIP